MNPRPMVGKSGFHEAPLALFSALAISAAGILAAEPVSWLMDGGSHHGDPARGLVCAGMLAFGLMLSLVHLGRWQRAIFVLRRVRSNPLSAEILFATATVLLSASWPGLPAGLSAIVFLLAAVSAACLLICLGRVYMLPGQIAWTGATWLMPLAEGVGLGFILRNTPFTRRLALILLLLDFCLALLRQNRIERFRGTSEPVYPGIWAQRRAILRARFVLLPVLAAGFLAAGQHVPALVCCGAGLLVERFAFYALSTRQTTESQVARIDRLLRSA